jgi:hypothetical protein
MTEVNLDLIKIAAREMFSDVFAKEANVYIYHHALLRMHELYVSGEVYGQTGLTEYEIRYPADWWQAVKGRFAPDWFKRRYPIKYTEHHIRVDAVYPELSKRLNLPKEPHRLILSHRRNED